MAVFLTTSGAAMIVITGATGAVGGEVVRRSSVTGLPVRAVSRRPDEVAPMAQVESVRGDFDDPASIRAASAGAHRAFLLTNSTERIQRPQMASVRAAGEAGVRQLVVLSQLHADPGAPQRIPRYPGTVEEATRSSELAVTSRRRRVFHACVASTGGHPRAPLREGGIESGRPA